MLLNKAVLCLVLISASFTLSCRSVEPRVKFADSDIYLKLDRVNGVTKLLLQQGSQTVHRVTLKNFNTNNNFEATDRGTFQVASPTSTLEVGLVKQTAGFFLVRVSHNNLNANSLVEDCVDLEIGRLHWYGGPQEFYQYWPIERFTFSDYSYIPKEKDNVGVAERYWLNSRGVFTFVEDETPLFINQNSQGYENQLCFRAAKTLPYDTHMDQIFSFRYLIGIGNNATHAHLQAVKNVLGQPRGIPDERMVRYPIWSTWAKYKKDIDESVVREFAKQIRDNKFSDSQLEIDDDWEVCYGALTFRTSKFPDIKALTDDLKKDGFRVTLWVHPFINKDCEPWYSEAKNNGYFVQDHTGSVDTMWWDSEQNGASASYIDFTNSAAAKWYVDRLKALQQSAGIDSYKFDAGETSWTPADPVLNASVELVPGKITTDYVRAVSEFGPFIEVRSGFRTQNVSIFLRMIDKDSEWNWNNGLPTLITTLLQLNMNGYPFVLPDMIGGNGYNAKPDKELFIRWLQANTFMPSLQFSYLPWDYDAETIQISQQFTHLHDIYTDYIIEQFKKATTTGEPVNAPIWWVDPEDIVAQAIWDEYLLGQDILVAPVVVKGATVRDIYLPKGEWKDGNNGQVHSGPKWLMSYNAPLETLPYFLRVGKF